MSNLLALMRWRCQSSLEMAVSQAGGGGGGILVEILEASPRMRFRRRFETRLAVRKEGGGVIRAGYPPLNGLYLGDKRRAESGLKAG